MTLPLKDLDFCQKTTWKFKCGMCPSVFSTLEQKKMHNLHHLIPCTMCRMMLRSRDQLLNHLRVVHNQTELTRVKHHDAKCKTYNLPVIPLPKPAKLVSINPSRLDSPTLPMFRRCRKAVFMENTLNEWFCKSITLLQGCNTLARADHCWPGYCHHQGLWVKELPS